MKPQTIKLTKIFIIVSLAFLIFGWAPIEFGEEENFFHGYLIEKPVIRIGLGVNIDRIEIASSSGMKVYEVNPGYKLIAEDVEEVQVKGRREKLTEKFLILAAQTKDRRKAEILAESLSSTVDHNVYISEDSEDEISGAHKVLVGDFMTRDDALEFVRTLNELGLRDAWIVREEITEESSRPLWILVNDELKSLNEKSVLYFIPSDERSYLSFNGRPYRGLFVLQSTSRGMVLTNVLNLENYLKSVVPSELSPHTYSELEAHKAQAVAARTYAMRHLGLNRDLGYDIDDTPRAQFYKGMSAEHPLSTMAVEATRGEAAYYKGKLINALYTSTCGGMTEDVENIFDGPALPYLRSTACIFENQKEWELRSKTAFPSVRSNGIDMTPEIALLVSLKVIPPKTDPAFLWQPAAFEEAVDWIQKALTLVGKRNAAFKPDPSPLSLKKFVEMVTDAFSWQSRVDNLVFEGETGFLFKDLNSLSSTVKAQFAYFIQANIIPFASAVGDPERILSRAETAFYLGKILRGDERVGQKGIFRGLRDNMMELQQDQDITRLALSPDFFLLKRGDNGSSFVSDLFLLGGEEIRVFGRDEVISLVEVSQPFLTNILDRSSSAFRWRKRVTRKSLERRINRYYPIGELVDVVPQKRGKSKRVIELLVVGRETQALVKGLRIRRVLGLGETLFVIEREHDQEGRISHFTFLGKGLGHGVGLCQVGAFGMAQAGADYKEILKKYYHGIKIDRAY